MNAHEHVDITGEELAEELLRTAIGGSTTPREAMDQLNVLTVAACHILCHVAYNMEKLFKANGAELIDKLTVELKENLKEMYSAAERGEIEILKIKTPKGAKNETAN